MNPVAAARIAATASRPTDVPWCVPELARAAMQQAAALGYTFVFSRPDFAGQLQITVRPPRGGALTWAIVGNDYERTVSYLTFVERLHHSTTPQRTSVMQRVGS